MQLKDKVIIITGGCQGLGRAMGEYLAEKGVRLALVDLNQEKLDEAVAACKAHGVEARAYLCNVANEEQVTHMVAQVAEDFGAINGLVNNAGILRDGLTIKVKDGEMTKMSLAQWQSVIDVNLTGVFLCTREVAAKMIELKNQGAIVNISSISRAGNMGQANYSAAKAGVAADTVVWAKELALRHSCRWCSTRVHRDRNGCQHETRSPGKNDRRHSTAAHGQAGRDCSLGSLHPGK
jgi:3-oxoacyl-[acyl-carrier protein] reductase